ncbi:MAG: bioY [Rhodospirillales bacterium]|nr:bioY [Rhodospirillales bacterium]
MSRVRSRPLGALGQPLLLTIVGTAAILLGARCAVPLGSTPSTLQSLALVLVAGLWGPRIGAAAVLLYAAAAVAGLPVLSFGSSIPFPRFVQSGSFGWVLGFLPAALLAGAARHWAGARLGRWFAVALAAHVMLIAVGLAWNRAGVELTVLFGAVLKSAVAAALLALIRSRR